METRRMTLLDRLRRRARWQDPDPDVRVDAVRQLPADDQDLLGEIARGDTEARVRRAAVRRLRAPEALAAAATDPDAGVREEATEALLALAAGDDATPAETALAALAEARHLASLVRSARLAGVRHRALSRIQDARALAAIAKTAPEPAIREEALRRVDDEALLLDIAGKSEHKDVAVGAVDRLADPADLEAIASSGRNKAAGRRARVRLEALAPKVPEDASEEPEPPATEPATSTGAASASELSPGPAPAETVETRGPEPPPMAPERAPVETAVAVPPPPEGAEGGPAGEGARRAGDRDHAERDRRERLARIEALAARLEGLVKAADPPLRDADAGLREARAARGDLAVVPSKLARRVREARAALFGRAQELREADEWSRWGNAVVQEGLCRQMEALGSREDLERVARELQEADGRWASSRLAPREEAEALRHRYQAARSLVKGRVDAHFARKAREEAESLQQKESLCERAESLAESTDWLKASEELKALQARWKQIGPTSRRRSQAVWKRFRAACDRFFTRREEDLRRRKGEWVANLARKEALCVRAEALSGSTDWEAAAAEVRKLQSEWKTIGPVQKRKSDEIWQRFRGACDAFFARFKKRDEIALQAKREEREALCREIEALVPPAGERPPAPEGLGGTVESLLARARQSPGLPADDEQALGRRLWEARNRLVEAYPESFRGTDLDPEANRTKKEKLCARVEAIVAAGSRGDDPASLTGEALARRLKEALASNTIGGQGDAAARRRAEAEEVAAAQAAWKRLGPVPGEAGAALEERFRAACARFSEGRRATR